MAQRLHGKAASSSPSQTAQDASHGFFSSFDESFYSTLPEASVHASPGKHALSLNVAAPPDACIVKAPTEEAHAPIIEGTDAAAEEHDPIAPVSLFRMLSVASDKWDVLLMIAGSVGAFCFGLIQPGFFIFFGMMINASETVADSPKALGHGLAKLALYMFLMSCSIIISGWTESSTWMYTAERQVCKLRFKLLKAILYQDIEFFDTQSKTAQIIGIMSSDIATIHMVIGFKIGKCVRFTTTFLAATGVGLYYCWQLALLTIATVPITAVLAAAYSKAAVKNATEVQTATAQSANVIEETTAQIRTIYSYTSERRQIQKFMDALTAKCQVGERGGLIKGLGLGALVASVNLSWAMLLWFGGILIKKHQTQAGDIITSAFCIIYAGQALGIATECLQRFADGKISTARVFQLMNKTALVNVDEGYKLYNISGDIVLQNVSFKYKSRLNVLVLDNVSLEIPAEKVVALVGTSGSGKSTIISLIERFYDPDKGEIFLDGVSLKSLNLKWLRTQIGLVGQEPVLFAMSIMENLLYARENATVAEIEAASKAANAHSFILLLPNGYQTQVGEGGIQLSGGQRQRLAIARAILKNPPILLLDEATSALDTQSERLIQNALEGFMQSRTTVIVAHRLSTIRKADKIVVLQNGRVAETGSHDTLINLGPTGAYYSLLQSQMLEKKNTVVGTNLKDDNGPRTRNNSTPREQRRIRTPSYSISFSSSMVGTPISPYLSTPIHANVPNENTMKVQRNTEESDWESYEAKKTMVLLLRRLISSKKKEVTLAIVSAISSGAAVPLVLFFLFEVCIAYTDTDQTNRDRRIQHVLLLLVLFAIISFFSNLLQHINFAKAAEFLVKDVMERTFKALLQKKVSWYDQEENNSGALTETFLEHVKPINLIVTEFASTIIRTGAIFCLCVGLAFKASWQLALLIMAILPVVTFGSLQRSKDVKCTHSEEMRRASANANVIAGEAVNNIRTVAALAAEEKILDRFKDSLQGPLQTNSEKSIRLGFMSAVGHTGLLFSVCFILYVSALLVGAKKASFLRCLQACQVLTFTADSLAEAMSMTPMIESARKAFNKTASITGLKVAEEAQDHGPETIEGRIEFVKLSFAYPSRPGSLVLRNFNLEVAAGKTVGIVGRSGSGKSSIFALLQRFYDPQSGHIKLDGIDISQLGVKWLRQRIALVQQQPALFTATIEENIRYGREDATEAEVREAAKVANADGFVSALPEGYRTHVGNKGVKLSGGQKQRIAIARAVLKQGKVMLLDEATSALDAETEGSVQEALEGAAEVSGATVLVVAHRLATVRSADLIAVVEQGRVAELGTHDHLIQRPSGLYAQLVRLQNSSKLEPEG